VIKLKQINGEQIIINADLITYIHAHPDTVIALTNGDKLMVEESVDEVIERVMEYKRKVMQVAIEKEET